MALRTPPRTDAAVVKQKFSLEMKPNRYIKDNMRFNKDVYRVNSGGTLKLVLNKPQEGPHTASLVKKKDLPSNVNEAFNCKVCNVLGKAHGADPNGEEPPKFHVRRGRQGPEDALRLQQAGRLRHHRGRGRATRSRST